MKKFILILIVFIAVSCEKSMNDVKPVIDNQESILQQQEQQISILRDDPPKGDGGEFPPVD